MLQRQWQSHKRFLKEYRGDSVSYTHLVLVRRGIITVEQLGKALQRAEETGRTLAGVLLEDGLILSLIHI